MASDEPFVERRKPPTMASDVALVQAEMRRFMVRGLLFMVLVFVPLAAYIAVTLHDEHIEHCSPPADAATARICDWTFPFHDHELKKEAP